MPFKITNILPQNDLFLKKIIAFFRLVCSGSVASVEVRAGLV